MTENTQVGNETETEEVNLTKYVGGALRGPKFGIFEQLLCQNLVTATMTTDSLRKVQLITEAALMLDPEKQKSLGMDAEKALLIYSVCTALQHKISTKLRQYHRPMVSVKFGFNPTQDNFKKFIEPWHREGSLRYYADFMSKSLGKVYKVFYCAGCSNAISDHEKGNYGITEDHTCKFCGANLEVNAWDNPQPFILGHKFVKDESVQEFEVFFSTCFCLAEDGYVALENSFLEWCMPVILETMRKLTEAVRPEVYTEIARMFAEAKKGDENL